MAFVLWRPEASAQGAASPGPQARTLESCKCCQATAGKARPLPQHQACPPPSLWVLLCTRRLLCPSRPPPVEEARRKMLPVAHAKDVSETAALVASAAKTAGTGAGAATGKAAPAGNPAGVGAAAQAPARDAAVPAVGDAAATAAVNSAAASPAACARQAASSGRAGAGSRIRARQLSAAALCAPLIARPQSYRAAPLASRSSLRDAPCSGTLAPERPCRSQA
mmetsp:Transcript_108159/g.304637  ORF Transcript_108159/g.304637 Transcript_108159/m.304637 type:complete len:223 (-) Transcript_108159:333-1001(-)